MGEGAADSVHTLLPRILLLLVYRRRFCWRHVLTLPPGVVHWRERYRGRMHAMPLRQRRQKASGYKRRRRLRHSGFAGGRVPRERGYDTGRLPLRQGVLQPRRGLRPVPHWVLLIARVKHVQ
jgi:hypothetical protein